MKTIYVRMALVTLLTAGLIAGVLAGALLWAGEAAHRVKPRSEGERPVLDGQVPENPAEKVVPESVIRVGEKLKIVTRTFEPPDSKWKFKEFVGSKSTHVDVFAPPGSLAPQKNPDTSAQIKVAVDEVPASTAETFAVRCEGNLSPPSGAGGKPPYWRAKMAKIKVDLDIDGTDEETEDDPGAVVVRNFGGNNAPRKKIILRAAEGASYGDKQVLTRSSTKVKVFTAPTGGTEITFNGSDNEFEATESKDLYVEGTEASQKMGDVMLKLALKNKPDMDDEVTFTVLWVDILEWKSQPSDSISDTNSLKGQYVQLNVAHTDNLGLNVFLIQGASMRGWGLEITGQVHPSNFKGEIDWRQDAKSGAFSSPPADGSTDAGTIDWSTNFPIVWNDGPDASWQVKTVDTGGKIYFIDFPYIGMHEGGQDAIRRGRWNFKMVTVYKGVRCSQIQTGNLRFSMKQYQAPRGTDWRVFSTVPEDNEAKWGSLINITWNLQ
jgi:hypothetical protein